ncbi:MAG: ribonuclease D [Pseudomonadota bacterium]
MDIITTTGELRDACARLASSEFVTVDTEFLRETTYWPKLCLIQAAAPGQFFIIDPLAPNIDLQPFFALMANEAVTKVFHAARQDVEIIYNLASIIPAPLFDTQDAAMVCGFGDSISYDQLVFRISGNRIDKSSRFTDWTLRPLSEKQLKYAAADVTHLRDVYVSLKANLEEQNRSSWVSEEMAILTSVETYHVTPERAWERMKLRVRKPIELAIMRELAAWREAEAQRRDCPRGRIIKDDAIFEISAQQPSSREALGRLRALPKGFERSKSADQILEAVKRALAIPKDQLQPVPRGRVSPEGSSAVVDLLKVLLKMTSERNDVAAKVIATVDELEQIACDDEADVPALKGWRRQLFGEAALKVKRGELALKIDGKRVGTELVGKAANGEAPDETPTPQPVNGILNAKTH